MTILKVLKEDNSIILSSDFAGETVYTKWRAYTVAELPKNFGCLEYETDVEGISEWFNYKGLTYVRD
tara:strand:+ start:313 stop:513 length:201 start_codon:yes stop_codon:yes gene_type:complete